MELFPKVHPGKGVLSALQCYPNQQRYWLQLSLRKACWFGWMVVILPQFIVLLTADLERLRPDPTTFERQYLSSNWLWQQMRQHCCKTEKSMLCNGMQYNTPHFEITPEIYGFQNIPNFFVLTLHIVSHIPCNASGNYISTFVSLNGGDKCH